MVRWYHQLNGMSLSKLRETVKDRETWRADVHGVTVRHDLVTKQQKVYDREWER